MNLINSLIEVISPSPSGMVRKSLIVLSMVLLLTSSLQISSAQADDTVTFSVSYHDYSPGDYFEYSGYTSSLFKSLNETYSEEDNYLGATANHMSDMKMSVTDLKDCEIGSYVGPCYYSNLNHQLNITLKWELGTSNYFNDSMILLVETKVEDFKSVSTEIEKRVRTIHLKSWFSTESGEEQYLEDKVEEILLISRAGNRPSTISVGDTWSVSEMVEINTIYSTRSNRGPWDVTTANSSQDKQLSFQVERYEVIDTESGIKPSLVVVEHEFMTENDTYMWLGEYGYPLKIEVYDNETLTFSAELLEYRYLKVKDPTASTSMHWSGICFGLFFTGGLIFVVGFAIINVLKSRASVAKNSEFDVEGLNEMLHGTRRNRTTLKQGNNSSEEGLKLSEQEERINQLMDKYSK